jgi:hypothetical protein
VYPAWRRLGIPHDARPAGHRVIRCQQLKPESRLAPGVAATTGRKRKTERLSTLRFSFGLDQPN